jgi:hypothetical protein
MEAALLIFATGSWELPQSFFGGMIHAPKAAVQPDLRSPAIPDGGAKPMA